MEITILANNISNLGLLEKVSELLLYFLNNKISAHLYHKYILVEI